MRCATLPRRFLLCCTFQWPMPSRALSLLPVLIVMHISDLLFPCSLVALTSRLHCYLHLIPCLLNHKGARCSSRRLNSAAVPEKAMREYKPTAELPGKLDESALDFVIANMPTAPSPVSSPSCAHKTTNAPRRATMFILTSHILTPLLSFLVSLRAYR